MPFPASPAPSAYTSVTPSQPHAVYYVGGAAPSFTLNKTGANLYTVRSYDGTVVSTGAVSTTTVTPAAPAGGWRPGWYRLYLTGPVSDSLFGYAYGSINFTVVRNDSRFPPMTTGAVTPAGVGADDTVAQAVMGMGFPRPYIADARTQGSLSDVQTAVALAKANYAVGSGSPYYDAARPRPLWCPFPNGSVDKVTAGGLTLYCKNASIDGSTVTVTITTGTSSGYKITVNSETYDNVADPVAAATTINAASALVKAFGVAQSLATLAATVIGNAYFNGVKALVAALYPDVTRLEGPSNEPNANAETAHQMMLFQAAVHAGNASALAIGPCPVGITGLDSFLAAGGGNYCDEISVHAYNSQVNGDINLGRTQLAAFKATLAKYGQQNKPIWQTESTWAATSVYGVYHPRRSRIPLLMTLQWEQFGVPRERNNYWYGISHGYWGMPAFWQTSDTTFAPVPSLYRTLAEETFGQTHAQALAFGAIGDRIFLGSIYTGTAGSTAVLVAQSSLPNATVTLNVTGTTGTLTVVDGFGNTSTATISGGKVTVPVSDIPTYVRLPVGAAVTVATCNDWPSVGAGWTGTESAVRDTVTPSGGVTPLPYINDGGLMFQYTGGTSDGYARGAAVPETVTLTWPNATRCDRVIIWTGCWQGMSALVDFDIQTSNDGTTWTTRQTVTKATPTSFRHGADSSGTGCTFETYWDEQWIFDVKLPAPVTAKMVRLNVRATSYGGEPDAQAVTVGGQGNSAQYVTIQDIAVLCDDNTVPRYATVA